MTNFATIIDTTTSVLGSRRGARLGASPKGKRGDLCVVWLALIVTYDGGIPLVSHAYLSRVRTPPCSRPSSTTCRLAIET